MTTDAAPGPDTVRTDSRTPASPTPASPAASAPASTRRHLYEVDIVRLLTFVCVVGVHAVSGSMNPDDVASGAFVSLLHFTRGTFFLLSAFVLTYAQGAKPVRVRRFWPRRFLYVGLPYLVWSVIYWAIGLGRTPTGTDVAALGHQLVTGTANYHLYFLLVSLQLYLVFPALVWLVRHTRGHHLALLLTSGALELVILAAEHYVPWPGGWAAVQANALVLFPTYQLYFVAGALAAVHHERFHAWVVGHPRTVVAALAGTAAVHVGVYLLQVPSTGSVFSAFDPLQPSVAPWTVAVTLGLYSVGAMYARRRVPGTRLATFVDQASIASFGVFLVHPLFLNTLLGRWFSWGYSSLDPTLSGVIAWSATLVLSYAFAALVVRTPLALPLAGRKRLRSTPTRKVTHA